jgi:hypothetical protein
MRGKRGWLRGEIPRGARRHTAAMVVSLLVALLVGHAAQQAYAPQPTSVAAPVAGLDADTLGALHDLIPALLPRDDFIPPFANDDEALLAVLPAGSVFMLRSAPDVPHATDLDDSELARIDGLIGGGA